MTQHVALIRQILAEKLRVSEELLDDETTLEELGVDSLTSAEIVIGFERHAGVRIEIEDIGDHLGRNTTLGEFIGAMAVTFEQAASAT